ncbi:MAG: hypothetical protein ACLT8E_06605 [Akkermansia sp.]
MTVTAGIGEVTHRKKNGKGYRAWDVRSCRTPERHASVRYLDASDSAT